MKILFKISSLILCFYIQFSICDEYKELLTIKQLPTGHIYNNFNFKITTNSTFNENGKQPDILINLII